MALATSLTSACGGGVLDHGFEHLGGGDHKLAVVPRAQDCGLLNARHGFQRQFHAQVAARDHHAIGLLQDGIDVLPSLRLLDLGHHGQRPGVHAAQPFAQAVYIGGGAHEGECHHVDALRHAEAQVGEILLG
jgi:hypothetical protein